jgi:hypothetical protein
MPPEKDQVNRAMSSGDRIDNRSNLRSPSRRPVSDKGEEVLAMFVSTRIQLALVAVASVVAAALLGGCPWGP